MEVLWQGSYPMEVALVLGMQYQHMEISRVGESATRVSLKSTAAPTVLDAVRDGDRRWIDPEPIIRFRAVSSS